MSEQGRNCLEVLGITSNMADQQQQQQAQIVSTYASAESSPNHSLSQTSQDMNKTLDSSSNSFTSQTSEHEKQNKLMQDLLNAINDQANKSPTLLQSEANKTVKSLIEKTIKEQLLIEPLNGPSNNSNVAPSASPTTATQATRSHSTSSVFSLFQNIFSKSSSSSDKSKQPQNSASNSPASSTSSPNPETSPFKLLVNEMANKSDEDKLRQSISAHNILSHSKSSDLAAKPADDRENLEKLATLTKKEHEKCDPILSTSINSTLKANKQDESQKETLVPSSSKEFCMNLNLKLASSVAQTAIAPVAILENHLEHSRFTSNASTSSIHNDLKIILEESKNSNSSNSSASLNEQRKESPKPQRPARHTSTTQTSTTTVSVEEKQKVEKEMVRFGPRDGHYRYEKDFLMNIREKKSGLIDNIYPEVFKAYCYCTSGKYWDPEKYFDIVQFPGEYDRAQKVEQNKQRNLIQNKQKRYQQQHQPQQVQQHQRGPKNNYKQHQHGQKHRTNMSLEDSESRKSSTNATSTQADKILLGLIKKSSDKELKGEENLLNMLQKPHQEQSDKKVLQELLFSNKEVKMKSALTAHELEMAQLSDKKTELPMPSPKVEILTSTSEIDLKNCSDAYQQLIKNLSNHPLSASPLINTHTMPTCHLIENGKENEQRINSNSNESANILKQMLKLSSNLSSEQSDMKNNKQHKTHNTNRHHKHHHNHKYEQKYQKQQPQQQQQQQDAVILTQQSNSSLESLMSKLKMDSQQTKKEQQSQHFNSLLNKIMTPNPTKSLLEEEKTNKSDDILKWFNNTNKNSFKMDSSYIKCK